MSEYQAYQFDCIHRTLSSTERKAVAKLSSHITVGASHAFVDYRYGDFKHNPINILERYFDLLTYHADWGSQTVAFRFDAATVNYKQLSAFALDDTITVHTTGQSILVVADFNENYDCESYGYFDEDERSASSFTCFYQEILNGDYRTLFIMWLQACHLHRIDDPSHAVPSPPGMNQLTQSHRDLIEFIGLDQDLLKAACQQSPRLKRPNKAIAKAKLEQGLEAIAPDKQLHYLKKLLNENPASVRAELIQDLQTLDRGAPQSKTPRIEQRVAYTQLQAQVEANRAERLRIAAQEKSNRRKEYIKQLRLHADQMWEKVPALIERKKTKDYELAALILHSLKFLSTEDDNLTDFYKRTGSIINRYPRLTGMQSRMSIAAVISDGGTPLSVRTANQREHWLAANPLDAEFQFYLLNL